MMPSHSPRRRGRLAHALALALAIGPAAVSASKKTAVAIPSGSWRGIDGNWSTIELAVGSNHETVDVVASTTLSELWVPGLGGCYANEPKCATQRGGLYDPSASKTWEALGTWQLSLQYLGFSGNGEYGMEMVEIGDTDMAGSTQGHSSIAFDKAVTATFNITDPFLGMLGLGITEASFDSRVVKSPLVAAVEESKRLPSYSYGYTAGAHYKNTPVSLTLGGYDTARYESHDVQFALTSDDNLPRTLVRGIEVVKEAEAGTTTVILSDFNASFTALLDTSTPFLWLPDTLCERFATALDLTWNSTLDTYTLTDEQYRAYSASPDSGSNSVHNLTFSLSDANNRDDLDDPLGTAGVVNITLPTRALVGTLRYPYADQAIAYGDPAVPFFALRKSGADNTVALGRYFFQEAYIRTAYDSGYYSLHQARFPADPIGDAAIVAIHSNLTDQFSSSGSHHLSSGALAGTVIGCVAFVTLAALAVWFFCRRRRRRQQRADTPDDEDADEKKKPTPSMLSSIRHPNSPVNRVLAIVGLQLRPARPAKTEEDTQEKQISEAPDHHQVYEMPGPPAPPVELDATDHHADDDDDYDHGHGHGHDEGPNAYERARIKLARELAGPVPAYSPPTDGAEIPPEKAAVYDAVHGTGTTGTDGSIVSPLTPGAGGAAWTDSSGTGSSSGYISSASGGNDEHTRSVPLPASARMQRQPFDSSKVVLLGPLPDDDSSSQQQPQQQQQPPQQQRHDRRESIMTLGSNFTDEEREQEEMQRRQQQQQGDSADFEMIHVPQLADRRYSWEEGGTR